ATTTTAAAAAAIFHDARSAGAASSSMNRSRARSERDASRGSAPCRIRFLTFLSKVSEFIVASLNELLPERFPRPVEPRLDRLLALTERLRDLVDRPPLEVPPQEHLRMVRIERVEGLTHRGRGLFASDHVGGELFPIDRSERRPFSKRPE